MGSSPVEVLQERLAQGEISIEEFDALRSRLELPAPVKPSTPRKQSKGHSIIGVYLFLTLFFLFAWFYGGRVPGSAAEQEMADAFS